MLHRQMTHDAVPATVPVTARPWQARAVRGDGWLAVSLAGALSVTMVEAVLIERRFGVFGGGFLAEGHLSTTGQRIAFAGASLASDLVIVSLIAAGVFWLCRPFGLVPATRFFVALAAGVTPLALYNLFSYQLLAMVGDAFDLSLMFDLVGGRPGEFLAVASGHLAEPAWIVVLTIVAIAGAASALQVRYRHRGTVRARAHGPAGATVCVVALCGTVAVTGVRASSETLEHALRRKPSAQALAIVVGAATDFDRDGAGFGARPADPDPFNAAVHPYATEIPGNGIDENGVGGDLPIDRVQIERPLPIAQSWGWRPDVVLILLESVRADAVGGVIGGKPVTPVLDGLAAAGGASQWAYSHNGFTYQSRYHLFTGQLSVGAASSLIDDFQANDYQVGYFSGQDDSFGGPELAVGYERADVFYDARSEPERRYTQFRTPGSLAVPAPVVTEQAIRFLRASDSAKPIFIYVNFHDTHFPYHHAGIEPLVSGAVVPQGAIRPDRAADVQAMYLNTLANVDREIGAMLQEVERVRGRRPAVIVTSDHGESLFDEGFLGHGYALNDAQTRVPFIAANLPIVLSEPFGHADIRGAMRQALAAVPESDPRPTFSPALEGVTFQYVGSEVARPRQIGFVSQSGRTLYDFRTGRARFPDTVWGRPDALGPFETSAFLDLVYRWESLALSGARGGQADGR
jgi:hypothetical protein